MNVRFGVLRTRDITAPLYDLHPTRVEAGPDCTHFCWTPMLYQPMFAQLRKLLQLHEEKKEQTLRVL